MSVRYLCQAGRPLIQSISQASSSARCSQSINCGNSLMRTVWGSHRVAFGRCLATSAARCQDEMEGYSSFKQKRRTEFQTEKESEDPLFTETHPRLLHRAERMSVPEFHEAFREGLDGSKIINVYGRVRSKRVVGKGLMFVDIVNEFTRLQVMINRKTCMVDQEERKLKFAMFRNLIEVGDHICRIPNAYPVQSQMLTIWQLSSVSRLVLRLVNSPSRPRACLSSCLPRWSRFLRSLPTLRRECRSVMSTCW
jgi:lysyl-tRNA synthetase class 2